MKKISGIYKFENLINGKVYIGLTCDKTRRKKEELYHLRNNEFHNEHLQKAWNKYGEENFKYVWLETCDEDKLSEREIYWVNSYGGYESENLYNIAEPGKFHRQSLETRQKMSKSRMGHPVSDETREKLRIANTGRKMTLEQRKKISEILHNSPGHNTGHHHSEATKEKIRQINLGRKHSEETKRKMSEARKGRTLSQETKDKIAKTHTGMKHTEATKEKLRQIGLGKIPWNKGIPMSESTKEKLRQINLGKKLSEEQKAKIGESHKGRIVSEETRRKMSIALKGKNLGRIGPMRGKHHSIESRLKMSKSRTGKKLSREHIKHIKEAIGKRVWVHNEKGIRKFLKEELLEEYLNNGWLRGM